MGKNKRQAIDGEECEKGKSSGRARHRQEVVKRERQASGGENLETGK
jgi:hypothetical protein